MKQIFIIILYIISFSLNAQDNSTDNCCQHEKKVPNEYISSRHTYQEVGEVDQHPFTMFKMDTKDFDYTLNS